MSAVDSRREPLLRRPPAVPATPGDESRKGRRAQAVTASLARIERIEEGLLRIEDGIRARSPSPLRRLPEAHERSVGRLPPERALFQPPPPVWSPGLTQPSPPTSSQAEAEPSPNASPESPALQGQGDLVSRLDIVQMSSPMYFVEESERKLTVEVMRLGSLEGKCKCKYSTEDGSAIAGVRYRDAAGEIVFKPSEHTKQITLCVIADDNWASTLEFKLHLTNPENCELGQYLHTARIKIIDNDLFPSSKFEEELEEGEEGLERISGPLLMLEYFKLVYSVGGISWRTALIILMDQMGNLYLLLSLFLNQYLVDVLFNTSKPGTENELLITTCPIGDPHGSNAARQCTAYLVALLYVLPMVALHCWDYYKVKLDLGGMCREYLQTNLFRKYLNYSERSRMKVSPSHMHVAIVQDTGEVVESYLASLNLVQCAGKLAVLVYFILKENPTAIVPVVVMPSAMVIWVALRYKGSVEIGEVAASKMAHVIELVTEACTKYRLIADYQQRPQICDLFAERTGQLSEAQVPVELVKCNNSYFPKWLGPILTGVYLILETGMVINGALSVGTFLATVRVFGELSEQLSESYDELISISSAIGPLKKLTALFNMETDLKLWKSVNRKRRELSKVARLEAMHDVPGSDDGASGNGSPVKSAAKPEDGAFRTDQIELKVRGLTFSYGDTPVLSNVNVHVQQGKLVAIVGSHGSGKSTLLRLLGHSLFPDEGLIFIPTHLRILHISQDPMMLQMTAWANLVFGRLAADPGRVWSILRDLDMPKTLAIIREDLIKLGKLPPEADNDTSAQGSVAADEEDDEEGGESAGEEGDEEDEEPVNWQDTLPYTEKAKLHLARALIVNPEVLVLHRPLSHYDLSTSRHVLDVIRTFVDNRGVHVPGDAQRRRPRTLFFSPNAREQAAKADVIWQTDSSGELKEISKERLRESNFE